MKIHFFRTSRFFLLAATLSFIAPNLRALETGEPTIRRAEPVKKTATAVTTVSTTTAASVQNATAPKSWLERYTLGTGDILDFGFYGRPDLKRDKIFVQPDGTISYLQASNIRAEGLTIDELRAQIETILGQFYKFPRVLITPVDLRSKKFFVVGKVVENGAYVMDRPTTLIEAISRAKGFESGLVEHRQAELADLSRSFVIRDGKRLSVSLESLFLKGDLSQNIQIEPNDYIYIALARSSDVYIFGEVARTGVQAYAPHLSVLAAITARGSYTKNAYREKVLVVRGSLSHPQVFAVNTNDILKGKVKDFELQGGDILYVSSRPWTFADQLADVAISAFFQGATNTWTGHNIPALITRPLVPHLRGNSTTQVQ